MKEKLGCAQVSNTTAEAATSNSGLGPVESNITGTGDTKSEYYPLPQNALVSCLLPANSNHADTSIQASSIICRSLLQWAVL